MNYRPVFIAGCDRSGTTLLGDLLGNSQWSVTTPESQFIHDLLLRIGLGDFSRSEEAAAWLQKHFRYATWDLDLDHQQLAGLIDPGQPRGTIENLVGAYAAMKHLDKPAADVWIDHTPDNFKYAAMLKHHFPDARFIHIVRDGRAVCASIKPRDWGPNNAYMASRHWADRLQEAMAVEVSEGANCLRVRFEDLLHRPAAVLREICTFIDLPFDENMLRGGGLQLPGFTRTQHSLVGSRIQPERADSWQRQLSATEVRDFESYPLSHTLLKRMGYATKHAQPAQLSTLRILGRYLHDFAHYLLHRLRHRRMEQKTLARHLKGIKSPRTVSATVD